LLELYFILKSHKGKEQLWSMGIRVFA